MHILFSGFSTYDDNKIYEYPAVIRGVQVKGNRPKLAFIYLGDNEEMLTSAMENWIRSTVIPAMHSKQYIIYFQGEEYDSKS